MIEQPQPKSLGIHEWMNSNNIVNEKGERLTFQDHMFLFDPYKDFSQYQVYKKCSQIGVSVMMNIKVPFAMKEWGWNVIYTLPSDRDVWEFVPTKTDKMIMTNETLMKELQTDKVELKQMYDRFWHFKGTRSKTAAIMTTADLLVHDEIDRSDLSVVTEYKSRIKRSNYRGIWQLSNPSIKNSGVDILWNMSDKKEWYVVCQHCKLEQSINWYKHVDYRRKEYRCMQCGKRLDEITIRLGRWIAENEDSEVSGYHISQMMAPWVPVKDLIKEEIEAGEEYFYNFILGEPVGAGDTEDFRQRIIEAWTPHSLKTGPQFMGVDIGSTKHYVIGNAEGIHTVGKLKNRMELEMLIEKWNPIVVMDAGPERTWAEEFRIKYPKLWICFYKRDRDKKRKIIWGEKENTGIVYADRSRVIDATITEIITTGIQFDVPPHILDLYIKHWEVMVKRKEIDASGLARFVWDKNTEHAQDHWCLVSDTKINTDKGQINIDKINIGDKVLTRNGYKTVEKSWMTQDNAKIMTVYFSNGEKITGTPQHQIKTGRGWLPLHSIVYGDTITICKLHSKGLNLETTQKLKAEQKEFISHPVGITENKGWGDYIKKFGKINLEIFRRVALFTTKTIIRLIIKLTIWNVSKIQNIDKCTEKRFYKTQKDTENNANISIKSDKNLTSGEKQKKVLNGIVSTLSRHWYYLNLKSLNVLNAITKRLQKAGKEGNSAQENVSTVGMHDNLEKDKVYNLTVKDEHEYFANNILVANCHASVYYYIARSRGSDTEYLPSPSGKGKDLIVQSNGGEFKMDLKEYMDERNI